MLFSVFVLKKCAIHAFNISARVIPRLRTLFIPLREESFWLLLFSALVLVVAAYQVPFQFELALGSPFATPIDQPFLVGFYPAEQGTDLTYRWTSSRSALVLEGIGSGAPLRLTYRAMTLRPDDAPPPRTRVSLDGHKLAIFQQASDWRNYAVEIPAERNPDRLELNFKTTPFQSGTDPRALGIIISTIRFEQTGPWTRTLPSSSQSFLFVIVAIGLYATLRQLGMNARRVLWVGLACLVGIAALVAWARPFYTAFSPNLVVLVGLNFLAALTLPRIARKNKLRADVRLTPTELQWLCLLFLVGFNVRLIAELYPTTMFGDSLFHLHRLDATLAGQILRASTAGAIGFEQAIPYPPALYLVLAPLATLFSDHLALLKIFISLVDSGAAFLIYLMVRVSTERSRAALFATALYLFLPIAVLNFAWAIYANLLTQFALLLGMTLWFLQTRHATFASWVLMASALCIAFLSHVTAAVLWVVFCIVAAPMFWFGFKTTRRALVLRPLLIIAASMLVSVGLYYAEFIPLMTTGASQVIAARTTRGGESTAPATVGGGVKYPSIGLVRVGVHSPTEWVVEGAKGLGREAWVYFAGWTLVLAPIGLYVLGRRERGRLLACFGWAGLLTGIFFALVGVILDMHVRYPLFILPFAAIGSGVALDAVCQRGRAATLIVYALLTITAGISFVLWKNFF